MDKLMLTNMPIIELEDIILRPVEYDDYLDMYEYGVNENVTKWVRWGPYKSIDDAIHSVKNVMLSRPDRGLPSTYAIVYKENNKMIGTIGYPSVSFEESLGDLAYALSEDYWKRGIVTKAAREVIKVGFNYLGFNKIIACHLPGNEGSKRVIERNGFKYIKEVYDKHTNQLVPWYELDKPKAE